MSVHYVDFNKKQVEETKESFQKFTHIEYLTIQKSISDMVDTLSFGNFIKSTVNEILDKKLAQLRNALECLDIISEMLVSEEDTFDLNPEEFSENLSNINIKPIFFVYLCNKLDFVKINYIATDEIIKEFEKKNNLTIEENILNFFFDVI